MPTTAAPEAPRYHVIDLRDGEHYAVAATIGEARRFARDADVVLLCDTRTANAIADELATIGEADGSADQKRENTWLAACDEAAEHGYRPMITDAGAGVRWVRG